MKGWTEYLMEKTNFSNRMSVQMKLRWMALEWLHLHRRIGKQGDGWQIIREASARINKFF